MNQDFYLLYEPDDEKKFEENFDKQYPSKGEERIVQNFRNMIRTRLRIPFRFFFFAIA